MVSKMSSVVTYTVHEPPSPKADRVDRAEDIVFVKDGFSWPTAIFPPLGFAAKGLWLPAAAYVAVVTVVCSALTAIGADNSWTSLIVMALNLFLGFEASSVHRLMLDRSGWQMLGSVSGKSLEECERRFFETWMPGQPMVAVAPAASSLGRRGGGMWPFGSKA